MKKSHIFITLMVLIMSSCASRENASISTADRDFTKGEQVSLLGGPSAGAIR